MNLYSFLELWNYVQIVAEQGSETGEMATFNFHAKNLDKKVQFNVCMFVYTVKSYYLPSTASNCIHSNTTVFHMFKHKVHTQILLQVMACNKSKRHLWLRILKLEQPETYVSLQVMACNKSKRHL